jgi:hypothetical protein
MSGLLRYEELCYSFLLNSLRMETMGRHKRRRNAQARSRSNGKSRGRFPRLLGKWTVDHWQLVVAIVALVATLIGLPIAWLGYQATRPHRPSADLSIVGFAVSRTTDLDVIQTNAADESAAPERGKILGSVIDITIKNSGSLTSLITDAEFRFRRAQAICNLGGGPIEISGLYDVKVPDSSSRTPLTLHRKLRYEVRPNSLERLAFTVGPERSGEPFNPWLYQMEIFFHYDTSSSPLHVGTATLAAPIFKEEHWGDYFQAPDDTEHARCLDQNVGLVQDLIRVPSEWSSEFADLVRFLGMGREQGSYRADEHCVEDRIGETQAQSVDIHRICAFYNGKFVSVRIAIAGPTKPDDLAAYVLEVIIRPGDGDQYRLASGNFPDHLETCLSRVGSQSPALCDRGISSWSTQEVRMKMLAPFLNRYRELNMSFSIIFARAQEPEDTGPDQSKYLTIRKT